MDQRFSKTLHDFILQEVSKRPSKDADPKNLTIGLEQEFFLLDLEGRPATHEASQKFLLALSHQPGWHIHERLNGALGDMMWRCSIDTPDGRYTAVKYDHHPHLMEVAFAYEAT